MAFTQLEFPILLVLVYALVWLTRWHGARKAMLLAVSYYFYAYWDYRFLALLAFSTLLDWSLGLAMGASHRAATRRACLIVSLLGNLGLLAFFKYFGFFVDSAQALLGDWGWHTQTLGIILPVGISFFTFQTLSYTIDVYRGHLAPRRNLLDFSLYVAFFPQLVAGPIVRASEFLPQLEQMPRWSWNATYSGLAQLLRGFVKKLLIADQLAVLSDAVFESPQVFSGLTTCLGLLAYTGQIYCDFSGYSDIATGTARLLGYQLPENFHHPYLATSIQSFWRRWHMTLSNWLRDYLYIPLGGNRLGPRRASINLVLTMLLGGLWHGAAWTFVLWGFWHGLMLMAHRRWTQSSLARLDDTPVGRFIGWALTLTIVIVGWSLFRSTSLEACGLLWQQIFSGQPSIAWYPPRPLLALLLLALEHLLWLTRFRKYLELPRDAWSTPFLVGLALWALLLLAPTGFRPFVYFQF